MKVNQTENNTRTLQIIYKYSCQLQFVVLVALFAAAAATQTYSAPEYTAKSPVYAPPAAYSAKPYNYEYVGYTV